MFWYKDGYYVDPDDDREVDDYVELYMAMSVVELKELVAGSGYVGDPKYKEMIKDIMLKDEWTEKQKRAVVIHYAHYLTED